MTVQSESEQTQSERDLSSGILAALASSCFQFISKNQRKKNNIDSRISLDLPQLLFQANPDLFAIALSFLPERRWWSV